MKRFLMLTVLTAAFVLFTACNNVNKPTYNGGNNGSVAESENSSAIAQNESEIQSNNSSDNEVSSDVNKENSSTSDGHTHRFKGATCTEPKKCLICGITEGEPEHRWIAATCMEPKTCIECNEKGDKLAPHIYIDGECTVCHQRDPNFEYVEIESTNWVAHVVDGSLLYRVVLNVKSSATPTISYTLYENISSTAECDQKLLYVYNGQRYIKKNSAEQKAVSIEDKSDTIELSDSKGSKVILERVKEENLVISEKVKDFMGYEKFLTKGITFCPIT